MKANYLLPYLENLVCQLSNFFVSLAKNEEKKMTWCFCTSSLTWYLSLAYNVKTVLQATALLRVAEVDSTALWLLTAS